MTTTPLTLRRDLASAYLRYIDTAYWLRDERLMAERRAILESSGSLHSECLLEPVLPVCTRPTTSWRPPSRPGCRRRPPPIVGSALFGDFATPGQPVRLREHQAEAVTHHFRSGEAAGRHVVVTSGTGSGKTE